MKLRMNHSLVARRGNRAYTQTFKHSRELPDIETTAKADVFGRGADQNLKAAGFDDPLHIAVEDRQILRTKRELNALPFARFQADSFKPTKDRIVVNDARHIR